MAEALKRLGGGRWASKDGRFTIESQSGTWALVDNEQTNEFGLPLVRGLYPTLTSAKEALEGAKEAGPAESPLAEQIKRAPAPKASAKKEPEPPAEPKWLRDLDEPKRRQARLLMKRLEAVGAERPEDIARSEFVADQPALARLAFERRIADALEAKTPKAAVKELVEAILEGRDEELGARWRLVDEDGRQIRELDV